ncbi:MAG TPA: discoidin domain-containing protein [Allosphingosinicella sp.]|nr:discoidin domain-containing protein [Allosphingosinicella sp.]
MRRLPALLLLVLAGPAFAQQPRLLDDFAAPAAWRAQASDGVTGTMRPYEGGLRLDYDFSRGSGYAFLRRALPLELPANFELRFRLRGQGPANALEIKLTDESGENVWWHRRADYVPPGEWQTIRIRRRQIDFAWGPTTDRILRRAAAIEFVVAAGSGGGRGWIAVDDLQIVPMPEPPAVPPAMVAPGTQQTAVDGDLGTWWEAAAGTPLVLDLGFLREFGGLVVRWNRPTSYLVELSTDGRGWSSRRRVAASDRGTSWLRMEESEARYIRIVPETASELSEVDVRPLAFGASANAFVSAVAAEASRGDYPRGFIGEQSYWTLIATPAGGNSGLMDEDGAIEIGRGGFSVEPFVEDETWVDNVSSAPQPRLLRSEWAVRGGNWASSRSEQSLAEGRLPIPTVRRRGDGWSLTITGFASTDVITWLNGRYTLTNDGNTARHFVLALAVRPFQVNPPQQFLNITGGVSPINRLDASPGTLRINDDDALRLLQPADEVLLQAFHAPTRRLEGAALIVDDPTGLASATYHYRMQLAPGESRTIGWVAPLSDMLPRSGHRLGTVEAAAAQWRAALGDVRISGPPAARPALDTLYTALAHVLATREGPALRPGSRSYARAWIRDGAMMSTALLRMGLDRPAIDFLEYYAPFQYPNGKVPCCVDARGADPVPEHDSHGELIHLVAQVHRYAPDMARLERLWPRVRAAADHIEALRQSTRLPANRVGRNRPLFGLLPPSISHEGYSARPAYSYWDDFWALTGLRDAANLAVALGRTEEARLLGIRAQEFRLDIIASLAAARDVHGISFIPGAADLGDFDATSTTVALAPAGLQHQLPADALAATFERYWTEFVQRREGGRQWDAYTPYEWRNVGAFVRLGRRDRAIALFDYFMADRRPAAWNQWAEVVGRAPREPRFIGDMPHGWVASDYINALLDMLAYERPRDRSLVLAAGIPDAWLAGDGISVERLRTPYGRLSYSLRADGRRLRIQYRLEGRAPPGGLVLGLGVERRLAGLSGAALLPR